MSTHELFEEAFDAWLDAACTEDYGSRGRLIREATDAQAKAMAALVWPVPVEWVDGRAKVGDVTVLAFAPSFGDNSWRFDLLYGDYVRYFAADERDDEATAKRLAITVAREMQR